MRGLFAFLACSALAVSGSAQAAPGTGLAAAVNAPEAREAIARVAYAEAGNQGDSGLAGVVYTILNRVGQGRWGASILAVVDAPHQFEPVMQAGGDWRGLRPVTASQQARIDTMLNLALDGRLPDPTGGALYFQNPKTVAARAAAGTVPRRLVNFGGLSPTAVIGDHAFYQASGDTRSTRTHAANSSEGAGGIFAGAAPSEASAPSTGPQPPVSIGERGLFVLSDGRIVEDTR
jgi:N-acetylmuramoyl-L-alanine amidase